jgi:hypothetical protein
MLEPCKKGEKRYRNIIHQPEYGGVDFRLGMHRKTREKCHENVPRNGANYLIKSHDETGGICHGSAHEDGANYLIKEHDIWAWEPSRRPVHRMLLCICPHPVILFPANLARVQGVRLWASGLEPKRGRKEQESHEASAFLLLGLGAGKPRRFKRAGKQRGFGCLQCDNVIALWSCIWGGIRLWN